MGQEAAGERGPGAWKSRGQMRKGERGEEELNIVSTQRGTPLPARPSRNQTASRRTGSVQTKSGGRGNGGRGSGRRAPLQAPGPFPSLPLYIPQSPPHSALQLKCRPRPPHSVRAGTGRVPRSRPQHNPGSTARSRLTSSAHPRSCRSVISAGVPTPPEDRVGGEEPRSSSLGGWSFGCEESPGRRGPVLRWGRGSAVWRLQGIV